MSSPEFIGFADANNLGWKLAAVIHGWADRHMLESYDVERTEGGLRTINAILHWAPNRAAMLRIASIVKYKWLRWSFLYRWIFGNSGLHSKNHFASEGMNYGPRYSSHIVVRNEAHQGVEPAENPTAKCFPEVVTGGRLLHVRFNDGTSLNDLVAFDGYTLFVVSKETEVVDSIVSGPLHSFVSRANGDVARDMSSYCAMEGIPLTVIDISERLEEVVAVGGTRAVYAGLYQQQAVILVRPDLFIAWHLRASVTTISVTDLKHVVECVCSRTMHVEYVKKATSTCAFLRQRFISDIQGSLCALIIHLSHNIY